MAALECPICYETYNQTNRVPYVLRCGHTLCHECVVRIGRSQSVKCGTCRAPIVMSQIKINFALRDHIPNDGARHPSQARPASGSSHPAPHGRASVTEPMSSGAQNDRNVMSTLYRLVVDHPCCVCLIIFFSCVGLFSVFHQVPYRTIDSCLQDSGVTCELGCPTNTICKNGHCLCADGFCMVNDRCVNRHKCNSETTGTCNFSPCFKSRGKVNCVQGLCVCKPGACSLNDHCFYACKHDCIGGGNCTSAGKCTPGACASYGAGCLPPSKLNATSLDPAMRRTSLIEAVESRLQDGRQISFAAGGTAFIGAVAVCFSFAHRDKRLQLGEPLLQ